MSDVDRPGDLLVSHPLKRTNYSTCKRSVMNTLISKHKNGFTDGRLQRPPAMDPKEED